MSAKRRAESQLGPDNWDEEEPVETEDNQDGFKAAPKEVLEKRVIRTAKRRTTTATGEVSRKPIFGGFSGFNKTQKSSFEFLANLTNGSKPNNESLTLQSDTTTVSSSSKITMPTSATSGIFSLSGTSTPTTKSVFGQTTSDSTTFGGSNNVFKSSVFSASKPDSTVNDTPFKTQSSVSSTPFANFNTKLTTNPDTPVSHSSTLFGGVTANTINNSPFSTKSNNTTNPTIFKTTVSISPQSSGLNSPQKPSTDTDEEKELVYFNNLKSLNMSVLAWIQKHVNESPLCYLTPIFRDYEKHLKNIQQDYEKCKGNKNTKDMKNTDKQDDKTFVTSGNTSNNPKSTSSVFTLTSSSKSSLDTSTSTSVNKSTTAASTNFSFGIKPSNTNPLNTDTASNADNATTSNTTSSSDSNTSTNTSPFATNTKTLFSTTVNNSTNSPLSTGFSFGIKPSGTSPLASNINSGTNLDTNSPFTANTSTTATPVNNFATPSTGFSFGIKPSSTSPLASNTNANNSVSPKSSPFAANTSPNNGGTPFSFGVGRPFAFNSNIAKPEEPSNEGDDKEDEPPKVEYTPIKEDNSVYDKKCKVFVKKDGNFIDKGVGTLYIKKIVETGKHQLLFRANTALGTVFLNMILSSSLPTQRMGKNNVMMVGLPTPDEQPPPTPIIIRVKTSEEADELYETLNKYKA